MLAVRFNHYIIMPAVIQVLTEQNKTQKGQAKNTMKIKLLNAVIKGKTKKEKEAKAMQIKLKRIPLIKDT